MPLRSTPRSAVTLAGPPPMATIRCFLRSGMLIEVARAERSVSEHRSVGAEEMAEQIGAGADALQLGELVGLDHAARYQEAVTADLADADEQQRGLARQREHVGDAELLHQHSAIGDRIGEHRHWQKIGFRAGALGEAMNDVERVGGEFPRQARRAATRTAHRAPASAASARPRRRACGHGRRRSPCRRHARGSGAGSLRLPAPAPSSGRSPSPRSGATRQNERPKRWVRSFSSATHSATGPSTKTRIMPSRLARAIRRCALVLWMLRRSATSDWVSPAAKYSHAARVASDASPSIIGSLSEGAAMSEKSACKFLHVLQKIAEAGRGVNPPNVLQRNQWRSAGTREPV